MAFTAPPPLVTPFCSTGIPGTDYITPPLSSVDPDIMTQQVGYPVSQATAFNAGGVPVTRPQTNGALNLYSSHIVWTNVGGQYTFDVSAVAAGGYNLGAVLFYFTAKRYVVSLMNSNTSDFVTTPSLIDGVHWQYLDIISATANKPLSGAGSSNGVPFQSTYFPGSLYITVTFSYTNSFTAQAIWSAVQAVLYTDVVSTFGLTNAIGGAVSSNIAIAEISQPSTGFNLQSESAGLTSATTSGVTLTQSAIFGGAATGSMISYYSFNLFLA